MITQSQKQTDCSTIFDVTLFSSLKLDLNKTLTQLQPVVKTKRKPPKVLSQ